MPRMKKIKERADGWSDWLMPVMSRYRMACCDCGLVHDLDFKVFKATKISGQFSSGPEVKRGRVLFRARRNNRSTAALRRKK